MSCKHFVLFADTSSLEARGFDEVEEMANESTHRSLDDTESDAEAVNRPQTPHLPSKFTC